MSEEKLKDLVFGCQSEKLEDLILDVKKTRAMTDFFLDVRERRCTSLDERTCF